MPTVCYCNGWDDIVNKASRIPTLTGSSEFGVRNRARIRIRIDQGLLYRWGQFRI